MADSGELSQEATAAAADVAEAVRRRGLTVAVAESLTGGKIAAYLGAAPSSATWFRGGVVAYADEVKFGVLDVPRGPVVTAECAEAMARSVAALLGADLAVAVTGVGGPEPQEGNEVGTVFFGVCAGGSTTTEQQQYDGETDQILEATATHALRLLGDAAR